MAVTDLVTQRLGHVCLTPEGPVVAGSMNEWTLVYTVGSYGIDEGGTLKLARRFASDWAHPQFDEPTAPNYTTVTTTGEAKLRPRYDPKAHVRPWMKCLVIDVYDGCLAPGDTVTITLGDRSQGSPGIRAQSFIESAHELRFLVDPTNACLVERLPSSPVLEVISGEPLSLVVIVPTQAIVGESAEIFVKGEDRWGNPTPAPAQIQLSWDGDGGAQTNCTIEGRELRFSSACSGRVVARWNDQTFVSNPITARAEAPRLRKYWGDLHAQSDATVGTGTEIEYFEFGRDWAHLDVMSHQGNDFQMSDEDWRRLNEVVRRFHQDGRFVVFPGYEWSANTAAGGDRNVMYLEEGMPIMRSSHWQVRGTPEDQHTPAHPANVLFSKLREHVDPNKVVLAAHCGGRYADIRTYFDEELGPLIEVMSCWGVFEWLLWDAFDKGYEVGVIANSDGHKGRPGAEGPGAGQFGIFGGLTCMLAESLTRAAVFDALRQRRCYGTTGPRMDLDFEVDGQVMGSSFTAKRDRVQVTASVRGVGPIESLQLFRGRELIHEVRPEAFTSCAGSRRIRLVWGGARIRGRGRRATWDGVVELEGASIERAQVFAFDSPMDGIQAQTKTKIELRSRTTGDLDGLDIWLDQAQRGRVVFRSEVGELVAELGTLDAAGEHASFGGLDLRASVSRYPESPSDRVIELAHEVELTAGQTTPLFVKANQVDGHIAWSSPIYPCRP
ncbi:hypothetical protein ENSA7_80720 [Enhygromyxa salina]|uniref:DUF3604 domain-containing protein n=1 Tax=Enhygromyxa salina TaxID=215803 RepID=A0A2S9XL87_9BACT|nr:hypothetical protein ENSA7_80720 [Enhygromyxa salina]